MTDADEIMPSDCVQSCARVEMMKYTRGKVAIDIKGGIAKLELNLKSLGIKYQVELFSLLSNSSICPMHVSLAALSSNILV